MRDVGLQGLSLLGGVLCFRVLRFRGLGLLEFRGVFMGCFMALGF